MKQISNFIYFIFYNLKCAYYFISLLSFLKSQDIRKSLFFFQIFRAAPYIFRIYRSESIVLYENVADKCLIVEIGNVKMNISNTEEWSILDEIYFSGDYNFHFPFECIVIDIGMNVGLTALYFARNVNIKKVFGFEPVLPSFQKALENININENIAAKIRPFNFGISNTNRSANFEYHKKYAGQSKEINYVNRKSKNKVSVELKSVNEVIRPIIENHSKEKIILKLDCEGAEYEIIESLIKERIIQKIHIIMFEWHEKEESRILNEKIKKCGFSVILKSVHVNWGMIYAFNSYLF